MNDIEVSIQAYTSGDVAYVRAIANVLEYEHESDDTEHVTFELSEIEVERMDGSIVEVDEEELEALLTAHDLQKIEYKVLDECRYSV